MYCGITDPRIVEILFSSLQVNVGDYGLLYYIPMITEMRTTTLTGEGLLNIIMKLTYRHDRYSLFKIKKNIKSGHKHYFATEMSTRSTPKPTLFLNLSMNISSSKYKDILKLQIDLFNGI